MRRFPSSAGTIDDCDHDSDAGNTPNTAHKINVANNINAIDDAHTHKSPISAPTPAVNPASKGMQSKRKSASITNKLRANPVLFSKHLLSGAGSGRKYKSSPLGNEGPQQHVSTAGIIFDASKFRPLPPPASIADKASPRSTRSMAVSSSVAQRKSMSTAYEYSSLNDGVCTCELHSIELWWLSLSHCIQKRRILLFRILLILLIIAVAFVAVPRDLQSAGNVLAHGIQQASVASESNTAGESGIHKPTKIDTEEGDGDGNYATIERSRGRNDNAFDMSALTAAFMFGAVATCVLALCSRWCAWCRESIDHDLITKVNADTDLGNMLNEANAEWQEASSPDGKIRSSETHRSWAVDIIANSPRRTPVVIIPDARPCISSSTRCNSTSSRESSSGSAPASPRGYN